MQAQSAMNADGHKWVTTRSQESWNLGIQGLAPYRTVNVLIAKAVTAIAHPADLLAPRTNGRQPSKARWAAWTRTVCVSTNNHIPPQLNHRCNIPEVTLHST